MNGEARGKHLLDYWAVLRRRRWAVYLGVAIVPLVALFGSFLSTPLYRATATLQIERQTPDILTFQDLSRVDYSWAAYSDFYQTQYQILASETVARRAAERVGLPNHPLLSSAAGKPGLLTRLKKAVPRKGEHREREPLDVAASFILGRLEVTPHRNSHLVRVSWVSPDPELTAEVANAVTDAYIEYNIQSQFSTSDQATEFLVNQIGELKREIAAIEDRLQDYGEAKRIVSVDDANNITMQALSDIARRRTEAQTVLAAKEAAFRAVTESPPEALTEVLESPLIAKLKAEYAAYEAELSEMSRLFKEDWPQYRSLASRLERARERLELETQEIAQKVRLAAESDYHKALGEVRSLDRLLEDHQAAAQRLRRDAVEFTNLQSEVREKRETLNALIARQSEMALSTRLTDLDATSSNIRVVNRARVPAAPFRPDTRFNVVLGIVLGLAFGVAAAFFLDYLDNTLSLPADVETVTSLPTLAVIPRHGTTPRVGRRERARPVESVETVSHRDGRAAASEAYRELRTAILLSGAGSPPRRLAISSALPSEGKSATAVNLAVVLSQLGRRVVLVDTDLRRPRLGRLFDCGDARGVSTFLSGLEDDARSLVIATRVDGLDLMPSGPVPPNPSELLNSPRFVELGEALLEAGYDHVVFDSPPTLSVADPVIIGSVVDALILVVRAGSTPRQSLRHAVEKHVQAGIKPIGVVLNDLSLDSRGYGYGTYRYHYVQYGSPEDAQPDRGDNAETA